MYCPKCGNNIADESTNFCPVCGYGLNNAQQPSNNWYGQPVGEYQQPVYNAQASGGYNQPQKQNTGLIIGVIIGVVVLIAAIVCCLVFFVFKKDNADDIGNDDQRISQDISSAETIKIAVETAMANEDTYVLMTAGPETTKTDVDGNVFSYAGRIVLTPRTATAGVGAGVDIVPASTYTPDAKDVVNAQTEIGKNIGDWIPKIMYKKAADGTNIPYQWEVYCTWNGTIKVGVGDGTNFYELVPERSKYYQ